MKKAFIVGNGPSLRNTPLNKLTNEVTFATNRIHLIYDQTEWRPNYYIRAESTADVDPNSWLEDVLINLHNPATECWMNLWYYKHLKRLGYDEEWENAKVINGCSHYATHYDDWAAPVLWHFPKLCTFGSSLHVAIQIATQLGYGPLFLLGVDLGFDPKQEKSHFHPEYSKGYEDNKGDGRIAEMNMIAGHIQAKKSSPVPIYNCTPGGRLEVYERMPLDEALDFR